MTRKKPTIKSVTVLIPVHNEQDCLYALFKRLAAAVPIEYEWSFLFVNDCSTDESFNILMKQRIADPRIGIISLSRCFGKEKALSAGLAHIDTDAVVIMDADLQDPPECLPAMVESWKKGYDVVAMKRSDRKVDSIVKRWCAILYYKAMWAIGDVPMPANVGDFRLISKRVVDILNLLPESNRNMKGLFAWVGFKTIELDYVREGRVAGSTKWPFTKLVELALDGISAHSIAPLRLSTYTGAFVAIFSVLFGMYTILKTLTFGEPVQGYTTLLTLVTFLGGLQLVCIGILGEYVGRTFIESKRRPLYVIDQIHQPNKNEKV